MTKLRENPTKPVRQKLLKDLQDYFSKIEKAAVVTPEKKKSPRSPAPVKGGSRRTFRSPSSPAKTAKRRAVGKKGKS